VHEKRFHLLSKAGIGSVDARSASDDEWFCAARPAFHPPVDDHGPEPNSRDRRRVTLAQFAEGRKVYLHCRSGIGRSSCIACAILGHRPDFRRLQGSGA
jgi:protein-tyrosine phosphatase